MSRITRWLFAPADDKAPRGHAVAAASLRVLLGLLWLASVEWKMPPDFGKNDNSGLYHFTSLAVSHPVLPPFSWVVAKVVLPNIALFGWGVLIVETALAVMLLTGAWVRIAAALGIAQSLAIGLSVAYAPNEWPWSYLLMIGAHLIVLFSSAGRVFAVDAVRSGVGAARTLGSTWGAIAVLVGLVAVSLSFGNPRAPQGPNLRSDDLEVGLGAYNLLGGLVLILVGAMVLVAARSAKDRMGQAAAVVAAAAAMSLHAQIGFSAPLLGGTATSAAFLFCLALVAAGLSTKLASTRHRG